MKISEIITDKYKLRIPPTVYYDLLADVQEAEEEQEPKMGHWIVHPKGIYAHLVCNKCLSCAPYDCKTNYCPNCGTKMEESEADNGNDD